MIRGYSSQTGRLIKVEASSENLKDLVWIDLVDNA